MAAARLTPSNHLFRTLAQTVGLLLLAAGLSGAATTASAQTPSAGPEADQWRQNFDGQMARQLRQEPSLRADFIRVVTDLATRSEDLHLSRTAEALLEVIEEDSERNHRVLAVQALSAIGPEHLGEKQYERIISRLYALSEEDPSAVVQAAAADVITRYQSG
jgi:hypothetical protein